jgi:phage baseplate assembly protein W
MNLRFPYQFGSLGGTASADEESHVRGLIEQVLFASPGERVNRPTFGSGLQQLVFAPNNETLAAAVQVSVQGALQQWLGDLLEVQSVEVASEDATLRVRIDYVLRRTQEQQTAEFHRGF